MTIQACGVASLLGLSQGFKKSRSKKLLQTTISRIKLLQGKREVQVKQLRRDVVHLLHLSQDVNAQARVERLWKESNLLSAYDKISEFCELAKLNIFNIAAERECPIALMETISSLCFAAKFCADLPELQEFRDILGKHYGKDFLESVQDPKPGHCVNDVVLVAFSKNAPSEYARESLFKSVCEEFNMKYKMKPQGCTQEQNCEMKDLSELPIVKVSADIMPGVKDNYGSSEQIKKSNQHSKQVMACLEWEENIPKGTTKDENEKPKVISNDEVQHASFGPKPAGCQQLNENQMEKNVQSVTPDSHYTNSNQAEESVELDISSFIVLKPRRQFV